MAASSKFSVWLESDSGERTPIHGSCFLGRAVACEVVLSDAKASRQHALVHGQEPGEFWLIDLGSANGTFWNGRRVGHPCRLSDGDKIEVAGFSFTFRRPQAPRPQTVSATDATVHELRKMACWLLIADIQGSTQMVSKLQPAEAHRVTTGWMAECSKILSGNHGNINQYLGDGFLAYWPAGLEAADPVARSLVTLKELQEAGHPPFRVVAHHGLVSVGGMAAPGQESLSGSEVNFVFRAERLASTLGLNRLLTQAAQAGLQHLMPTQPQGRHALRGFTGEFPFYSF